MIFFLNLCNANYKVNPSSEPARGSSLRPTLTNNSCNSEKDKELWLISVLQKALAFVNASFNIFLPGY